MKVIPLVRGLVERVRLRSTGIYEVDNTGIFIGPRPRRWPDNIDILVNLQRENAFSPGSVPGHKQYIYCPLYDAVDNYWEPDVVRDLARQVADYAKSGEHVLVHCRTGYNRSGLVIARALMFMGYTANDAIRQVRIARGENMKALFNTDFVKWLKVEV